MQSAQFMEAGKGGRILCTISWIQKVIQAKLTKDANEASIERIVMFWISSIQILLFSAVHLSAYHKEEYVIQQRSWKIFKIVPVLVRRGWRELILRWKMQLANVVRLPRDPNLFHFTISPLRNISVCGNR